MWFSSLARAHILTHTYSINFIYPKNNYTISTCVCVFVNETSKLFVYKIYIWLKHLNNFSLYSCIHIQMKKKWDKIISAKKNRTHLCASAFDQHQFASPNFVLAIGRCMCQRMSVYSAPRRHTLYKFWPENKIAQTKIVWRRAFTKLLSLFVCGTRAFFYSRIATLYYMN